MTTNVFDGNVGFIATDSRWSIPWGNSRVIYIDNTPFNKIEVYKGLHAFIFAGKADRIQIWKNWIRSDPTDLTNMPACEGMSVCIVDMKKKTAPFHQHQDIVKEGGYFAGSGSRHAFECWATNRDAMKCVETAKLKDFYSGGEVKFVNLDTGAHNLTYPVKNTSITDLVNAIFERGEVMTIGTQPGNAPPFKLKDLAANDAAEIQAKLASGEMVPEAPCDGMYNEWTEDDKSRLKDALKTVFSIA